MCDGTDLGIRFIGKDGIARSWSDQLLYQAPDNQDVDVAFHIEDDALEQKEE